MSDHTQLLFFLGLCFAIGIALLSLSKLRSRPHPYRAKKSRYECGFKPFAAPRVPVDVRFILVAILFVIFDVEVMVLFPWAVACRDLGWSAWAMVVSFLTIVTLGFVYEWHQGALSWGKKTS